MSLKVCQYCGLSYESAIHHDCPQVEIARLSARIVELEGALEECAASFVIHEQHLGERKPLDYERLAREFVRRIELAGSALSSPHPRGIALLDVVKAAEADVKDFHADDCPCPICTALRRYHSAHLTGEGQDK